MSPPPPSQPTSSELANARAIRRVVQQWPLIATLALVVGAAGFAFSATREETYEATTTVRIGDFDPVGAFLSQGLQARTTGQSGAAAKAAAPLFELTNVRERAARALKGKVSAGELSDTVEILTKRDSDLVSVVARDQQPALAQAKSDAVANAYIEQRGVAARAQVERAERQVRRRYEALSARDRRSAVGRDLRDRLKEVGILGTVLTSNVEIVQEANVPTQPVSPRPKRDGILALLLGAALGTGATALRARFDDRLRDVPGISEVWDLPVVGLIPQDGELQLSEPDAPAGAVDEAISLARTSLRYLHVGGDVKTLLVTSAGEGEGKSTIAWLLARANAQAQSRTLLIEADLRRPSLSAKLPVEAKTGLSEVLAGIADFEEAVLSLPVRTLEGDGTVDFLPAGMSPPNPVVLLERPAMRQLLERARQEYDLVIVDTPPATVVADVLAFVDAVDAVLLVTRLGSVHRPSLERLKMLLEDVPTPVIGQVINSVRKLADYSYARAGDK